MKNSHPSKPAHLLAALATLALACQLSNKGSHESRPTSANAPRTAALSAPPPAEADEVADSRAPVPCAATEFNYPLVKAACDEDGRRAVKKIMNGAIAKAKRQGTELACSNCHVDQKTFGLRPNAVEDLAGWL